MTVCSESSTIYIHGSGSAQSENNRTYGERSEVIAIILAGGYARRLRSITHSPKPLLQVAGKPVLNHIFDKLTELEGVQRTIISTNLKFERLFRDWCDANSHQEVEIVADRSRADGKKPGAIRSLAETTSGISEDCLIIGGDNLFTSSLKPMIHTFKRTCSTVVALYDVKNRELTKQYSTATLDSQGRIIDFVEKPARPGTTLAGTCIYIMPEKTFPRLKQYLAESTDADRMGSFIQWLHTREEVYGYVLDGYWCDIGTPEQYKNVQERLKERDMKLHAP